VRSLFDSVTAVARHSGELAQLTAKAFRTLVTPPYEGGRWLREMEQIGVRSLGVAAVTTIFTGMVLALQTAYSLPTLGIKYYIGTVVSKSLVRELGPVLTALIVGGRIGAGMTAELGTMKLVAPKLMATLIMLPALTILGDAFGTLGGLFIAVFQLDITAGFYMNDVIDAVTLSDVWSGIGKSIFFAYFITIIGCYNGLKARGGADGVGRATTNTVVLASIMVLVSDFFLTKLFHLLF
jgi:phospholipid/cholesterol/gamma-HCH transport system permease protein